MDEQTNSGNTPADDAKLNAELDELYERIAPFTPDADITQYVYFVLLLWASFRVYQLEPPVEAIKEKPDIIKISNGRFIFDYGFYLSTSSGEDYGSYSTGKVIEAAQEMMSMLASRGATKVAFAGHTIPQRAAWVECIDHNIESNFYPQSWDWDICERILRMRKEAKSAQVRLTGEKRPE